MGQLWKRNVRVVFGVAGDEFTSFLYPIIGLSEEQLQQLRGGPAPFDKVITDLRVVFDVKKDSEKNANTAKINIYNLNKDSQGLLQNQDKELTIVLEVGYGLREQGDAPERFFNLTDNRDYKLLFVGNVTRATTVRKGPDWITQIEAEDGGGALNNAHLNKSFSANSSIKTMAEEAIKSMVEFGGIIWNGFDSFKQGLKEELKSKKTQSGETVSERAAGFLERIMKRLNLEVSVQSGELIIAGGTLTAPDKGYKVSPETGMVGSPMLREEGIEVETLIFDPRIQPNDMFVLDSENINGNYRVRKAVFKGDNYGPRWTINIEADQENVTS